MAGTRLWTFTQWRNWAVGKHIDIDGHYGAQCWDAFADYAIRCVGTVGLEPWTSGNAGRDSGLVSSIWLKFPAHKSIEKRFHQISRHDTPREGDVVIWARSRAFPDSHIGVCTGRTRPGLIEVISQNVRGSAASAAGPVSIDWLTTAGVLGYLRPGTHTAHGQEEDGMQSISVDGKHLYGVSNEYITHYGDTLQADITRKVMSATDELHALTSKQFNSLLDGLGIPRDVVRDGTVLNPQSGKRERNGTWSRNREVLAALAKLKA